MLFISENINNNSVLLKKPEQSQQTPVDVPMEQKPIDTPTNPELQNQVSLTDKEQKEKSKFDFSKLARNTALAGSIIGGMALLHKIHHSGGLMNSLGIGALGLPDNNSVQSSPEPRQAPKENPKPNVYNDIGVTKTAPLVGPPPQQHQPMRTPVYAQHMPQPGVRSVMVPSNGAPPFLYQLNGRTPFNNIHPRQFRVPY